MALIRLIQYFLCYLSAFCNSYVLIYHTENSPSVQYYDCMYYTRIMIRDNIQGVKYCRQLKQNETLNRDFNQSCHHGGKLWSFEELSLLNVSISDVLRWSSSIEQVDHYSKYLSHSSIDVGDKFLCNCTNLSSFGKFCEYLFYGDTTSFDQAITKQFEPLENSINKDSPIHVGSQLHGNRPCYTTFKCDSGLMCLDWRHICDGKQQCMDGLDEDYCEKLEFNECEDDEYRCANGMCIPQQYWLDGDYDCMDWTDEMNTIVNAGRNCYNIPSLICDEHLCPYNQWSCGDGQCVNYQTDRHKGIYHNVKMFCKNLRDVNYMCESVTRDPKFWWTIDGGYCLPYSLEYQTLSLDTTAATSKCRFSLKCALSDSLDQNCQCKNSTACRKMVNSSCANSNVVYPGLGPLISPYVSMMYARDRDWTNKKPDKLMYRGRVKCIGYQFITNVGWIYTIPDTSSFYDHRESENLLCNMEEGIKDYQNFSGPHYDINCWNNSKTFNNHSYQVSFLCETRCISKYRIRDGIHDCYFNEEDWIINNSCPQIQRHRLQCSPSELTCLLVGALGNWGRSCSNGRDEIEEGTGIIFADKIRCNQRTDPGCVYLRNYIQISSLKNPTETIVADNSIVNDNSLIIPFRLYCNSFLDTILGIDESTEYCDKWICLSNQYQCLSGQCISQDWICDGEWDCSDGSDEQRLFIMDHLNAHNSELINLIKIKEKCSKQYRLDNTPFSNICNLSFEYPCFRSDINDPFNLTLNRPCIHLAQIGDGKIDCLTALDERNRLQCSDLGMLGFHFRIDENRCAGYFTLCSKSYPWTSGNNSAYDSVCFHQEKSFKNGTVSNCNSLNDVMCLNDVCLKNARCNGIVECLYGEDEYRCVPQGKSQLDYRGAKNIFEFITLKLRVYPSPRELLEKTSLSHRNVTNPSVLFNVSGENSLMDFPRYLKSIDNSTKVHGKLNFGMKSVYEIVRDSLPDGSIIFERDYLPFICNRGIAVKYLTDETVCFCSPSYYGSQCEYFSDRITILTHLNLTNYRSSFYQTEMIKVLTTFLLKDEIIDSYEFHVYPKLQTNENYIKQGIYFVYPRSKELIEMKKLNHDDIDLYNVRFEAFQLYRNETIKPIGVWEYPIHFHFLPSFRLSKILNFDSSFLNGSCLNNSCGNNGTCQQVFNSNHFSYFCSCNNGFYGINCEYYDEECNDYCSPKSICKPNYTGILTGNRKPLCLCSVSTFGRRCYFKNDKCQNNPCLNGGSCFVTYDFNDIDNYICLCIDSFSGDHCQVPAGMVEITFDLSSESRVKTIDIIATTISYNDYNNKSLSFIVRHQQVYRGLPSYLKLIYSHKFDATTISVLKAYRLNYLGEEPEYYILYFYPDQIKINITIDLTSENHCPLVETLWHLVQSNETSDNSSNLIFNSTTSVFWYHLICQSKQNSSFFCFRDLNYLCICEFNDNRAECFEYNRLIDQCSLCLSGGYCLKGELDDKSGFICLCPRCHFGVVCEYSNELMSFTLDSLIVKDIQTNTKVSTSFYILISIFIFLFGLFNNLCSFLTFVRPKSRQVGVGNYLLIVSVANQCSLMLLLFKIVHIIFGSNGTLFHYENFNQYSCKIISYLLSVFTRITYWLTSLVTIERLCMVIFPTSVTLKKPRLTLALSLFTILTVGGMHFHEWIYYTTIIDPSYRSLNITLCVTNYIQESIPLYNRVNVLIHYFIPFLIQFASITFLIIEISRSRARTISIRQQKFIDLFKSQLKTHREHYVTPLIIVLSSLPQSIFSFSYACTELKESWQRYSLLTSYFVSYLPQILGFILYVLPSTTYTEEFHQTMIGKRFARQPLNRRILK